MGVSQLTKRMSLLNSPTNARVQKVSRHESPETSQQSSTIFPSIVKSSLPKAIESTPKFMSLFVGNKSDLKTSFRDIPIGHCRDGFNAPPSYDMDRAIKEIFTESISVQTIMDRLCATFDIQQWEYRFPSNNFMINKICFPVEIFLTPTTKLTIMNGSELMRYRSQLHCQCDSKRTVKKDTFCYNCSTICEGVVSGPDTVCFKDYKLKAPDIIDAILVGQSSTVLYPYESPCYGNPKKGTETSEVRKFILYLIT